MRARADCELGMADVGGAVQDLSLEIRHIDDVEVDKSDRADPRGGEIERCRRAEAARADEQHTRRLDPPLAVERHIGENQVAAVALDLVA